MRSEAARTRDNVTDRTHGGSTAGRAPRHWPATALPGAVVHELRQPLTTILLNAQAGVGMLDAGVQAVDHAELRSILHEIIRADQRATVVMGRARALMHDEPLTSEPVSLPELIADALAATQSNTRLHQVATEYHVEADVPAVLGDRGQLQQVLINLIVNACEAMVAHSAEVRRLVLSATTDTDGFARISVSDTGPGISTVPVERVFEPFYTSKAEGMGIGLALCHKVVATHGGEIWVANNDLGGATFVVRLHTAQDVCAQVAVEVQLKAASFRTLAKRLASARAAHQRMVEKQRAMRTLLVDGARGFAESV